jgi:hypothetical protein
VSGSTSVACWLAAFVYGSELIWTRVVAASAANVVAQTVAAAAIGTRMR